MAQAEPAVRNTETRTAAKMRGWTISTATFLLTVAASTSAVAQFSDNFTIDTKLNSGWTLSEPNPLSSSTLNSSGLTLTASGSGSDLWPLTNYKASLLLQPIAPTANYTVTVDLSGYDPKNSFSGAGIVLTQQTSGFNSSSEFERLEYANLDNVNGLYRTTNGASSEVATFAAGTDTYLRLTKSGTSYTISYSTDGSTFKTGALFTDTTPYTYIGLISSRWPDDGQTSVNNVADFKSFEVAQPSIASLQPNLLNAGSAAFTLTVNGSNFVSGDTVDWNGVPLATTFVSASKLTAKVSAAEVASAGSAAVTVVGPAADDAVSQPALFTIPLTSIVVAAETIKTISGGYSITLTLKNAGFNAATDISLTEAYLVTSATSTTLPIDIASISPSGTKTVTLSFPSSTYKAGDEEYVLLYGSYTGGGIALSSVETLP